MKKSILAGFIGLSIVMSLDSISRVVIALYVDMDILMFSYSAYPGIFPPLLITAVAAISSFLGAIFSMTYGKNKKVFSLILYTVLLLLLRYLQINLLIATESITFPIIALILSLVAVLIAWKMLQPKKTESKEDEEDFKPDHHPVEDEREHPPH